MRRVRAIGPMPRRAWLAGALLVLAGGWLGPADGSDAAWRTGVAVPIAVHDGRARFRAPTEGPGARVLVIASVLARGAGTWHVALTAREAGRGDGLTPETAARSRPLVEPVRVRPELPPVAAPVGTLPPSSRTFHLMVRDGDVASASNYDAITGVLRAVGRRVQVYVDSADVRSVEPGTLVDLVSTFDERVHPVAASTFGQASDTDADGRFTIFMSSWLSRLAGGRHAVDGFVRGADFDPATSAPFSNQSDMMYLSTTLTAGPHLRTVLAHEYTHAVSFCARAFPPAGQAPVAGEEEGWLDEAIAHLVEDLHGFSRTNLDYRVSAFLSRPERYRLVVDDYYTADLFRGHGNRGATYLFLRWCADQYGPDLLPALVWSGRRGLANLEAATGASFEDLYRAWTLALFRAGFDPADPAPEGFRTLGLRGPFNTWELAGPRTVSVPLDGRPTVWDSAGTASRFLVIESASTGTVEIDVQASAGSSLQVTALPLPADLPRLELSVTPHPDPTRGTALVAQLTQSGRGPVRLTSVSWEPLVPGPDPHAAGFRHGGLDPSGITEAFGTSVLPEGGRFVSAPIDAESALAFDGRLVVKAVGTDRLGRRVAAWTEIGPPSPGPLSVRRDPESDPAARR